MKGKILKDWFTADTHFGSERTLKLSRRPFSNTSEMDTKIIENWNSKVNNEDTVYHFGDFGDYDVFKKLNGNIVLIMGNYEEDDMKNNFNNNWDDYSNYIKKIGFKDIIRKEMVYSLYINDALVNINCCHKPEDCNMKMFNLFGHIHALQLVKKFGLNVGIDAHHFYPIDTETIKFYKEAIEKYYDKNVFM
jgi:calcineurin-like phosphoesterase family protein